MVCAPIYVFLQETEIGYRIEYSVGQAIPLTVRQGGDASTYCACTVLPNLGVKWKRTAMSSRCMQQAGLKYPDLSVCAGCAGPEPGVCGVSWAGDAEAVIMRMPARGCAQRAAASTGDQACCQHGHR